MSTSSTPFCPVCLGNPCMCTIGRTLPDSWANPSPVLHWPPLAPYALDMFAGPGGWEEGLRLLGMYDLVVGLEHDADACATARAAGFVREKVDVRAADPSRYRGIVGLIASPPCQTFSAAGKSKGKASLDDLSKALALVADGVTCADAATACGLDAGDPRTTLVLEPMRFIRALRPQWIAFENVVQVLPVWKTYADLLSDRFGYSTWAGVLNAADYGVPQARKRAFLMAATTGAVQPPEPTHSAKGDTLPPWVTMAEALEWGPDDCVAHNLNAPAAAHDPVKALWPLGRAATTIVRSFRPDVVSAPGYRMKGDGPRQNSPGSIGITPEQMCVLQGIRTDYPFSAKGATKRLSLIGAILPPPWAAAVLGPLIEMSKSACRECGNDDPCEGYSHCSDCMEAAS